MNGNPSREEALVQAMGMLDEEAVKALVAELTAEGYNNQRIFALLNRGVDRVGTLFESGEYFLADLIAAGSLYSEILSNYQLFCANGRRCHGRVLIGVMAHDIHDIGKDVISGLLRVEGFEVIDLGTDVDTSRFVTAALQYRPNIIAMCGMLLYSSVEMQRTMAALEKAGVHNFAKIIIGGGCVNESVCERVHADAYFTEPLETLEYCKTATSQAGDCHEK